MAEVSIQPPSDVYDTFGRLSYKPWYALGEFVDNATQNFSDHRDALAAADGQARLHLDIDYKADSVSICDDANGMNFEEFSRAIRLNARPPDRTGRSEFGMGLKTAACWFGRYWTLTSTRLGEPLQYEVTFDLEEISLTRPTTIRVAERAVDPSEHGTRLHIEQLRNRIHGRAGQTVRKSLASMYRGDLTSGDMVLKINGERLEYDPPALHSETMPDGRVQTWQSPVDLTVTDPHTGLEHQVTGWFGIRDSMSRKESGFALLRRGRLVVGGYDAGWRPGQLFGQTGSPIWQRLTGELRCDSFPVTFSKDGFAWDSGLEEALVEALLPVMSEYRQKANNIRRNAREITPVDLGRATSALEKRFEDSGLRRDLTRLETPAHQDPDPTEDPDVRDGLIQEAEGPAELKVPLPVGYLTARLYSAKERPGDEWMTPSFARPDEVDVFLNTAHPYVAALSQNEAALHVVIQFALATALAEKRARLVGGEHVRPDDLRMHLDTFLRHAAP